MAKIIGFLDIGAHQRGGFDIVFLPHVVDFHEGEPEIQEIGDGQNGNAEHQISGGHITLEREPIKPPEKASGDDDNHFNERGYEDGNTKILKDFAHNGLIIVFLRL